MFIDGIGKVTFVNNVLRVQATSVNGEGKVTQAGTLEIPGSAVGAIIQGLADASTGIIKKLNEDSDSKETEVKKSAKSKKNKK